MPNIYPETERDYRLLLTFVNDLINGFTRASSPLRIIGKDYDGYKSYLIEKEQEYLMEINRKVYKDI